MLFFKDSQTFPSVFAVLLSGEPSTDVSPGHFLITQQVFPARWPAFSFKLSLIHASAQVITFHHVLWIHPLTSCHGAGDNMQLGWIWPQMGNNHVFGEGWRTEEGQEVGKEGPKICFLST